MVQERVGALGEASAVRLHWNLTQLAGEARDELRLDYRRRCGALLEPCQSGE